MAELLWVSLFLQASMAEWYQWGFSQEIVCRYWYFFSLIKHTPKYIHTPKDIFPSVPLTHLGIFYFSLSMHPCTRFFPMRRFEVAEEKEVVISWMKQCAAFVHKIFCSHLCFKIFFDNSCTNLWTLEIVALVVKRWNNIIITRFTTPSKAPFLPQWSCFSSTMILFSMKLRGNNLVNEWGL